MSSKNPQHRPLEILHRLREYALEQEEVKLMERQREELAQQAVCEGSLAALQDNFSHGTTEMKVYEYARRDVCIREAGIQHNLDLRHLGLAQFARREQVEATLKAKAHADMIARVLERRRADDLAELERIERRENDEAAQNQFTQRAMAEAAEARETAGIE
ncbi:hypothetical protein SAMN05444156_2860 [Verrucomicrobium sp. GAS474]|uniref:hypothetical protein n=1 Tax=Verrucomicrobium sp. GAS474 TaxID=1882831 RepID=UPI00087BAB8F|nr:hypothetical protein [Verrucomicrobium sp. GAS474]SDU25061.1 hypothetical protein SAMN05444156_2860 [Verrucomicrobium sp. GAS474]